MKKIDYALWTGGWDSTFMIILLLRQGRTVKPIYLIDKNRASTKHEKEAMIKIRDKLKVHNYFGGKLLSTEFTKVDDIPKNKQITETWEKVHQKTLLGPQHEWLARYAVWKKRDLYLGHEKVLIPNGHLSKTLNDYTVLKRNSDNFLVLNKQKSSKEGIVLFEKMIFPIMDYLETDMIKEIKKWKAKDVMRYIWFCHNPTHDNKPCGNCHPCKTKLKANMGFLLPKKIYLKYKLNQIIHHHK